MLKRIAVIGTGYVGLVSGTCFAEVGNSVVCCDIDAEKIRGLSAGVMPIYENGLKELVDKNVNENRLFSLLIFARRLKKQRLFILQSERRCRKQGKQT